MTLGIALMKEPGYSTVLELTLTKSYSECKIKQLILKAVK